MTLEVVMEAKLKLCPIINELPFYQKSYNVKLIFSFIFLSRYSYEDYYSYSRAHSWTYNARTLILHFLGYYLFFCNSYLFPCNPNGN